MHVAAVLATTLSTIVDCMFELFVRLVSIEILELVEGLAVDSRRGFCNVGREYELSWTCEGLWVFIYCL